MSLLLYLEKGKPLRFHVNPTPENGYVPPENGYVPVFIRTYVMYFIAVNVEICILCFLF